jgi:SecD/SecF fusion protein
MTDRRRNLFVLLLVTGLLLASAVLIWQKPTRLGLDLKGGGSLIYQAKPTKQSQVTGDAIDRSIEVMRKRVDQLGVAEPEIQRSGPDQIDVSLPDVKNADEARSQVGTTAQMWFYDWEGSVLGKDCRTHPQDAQITGGQKAGSDATALSQYDAVTRAASCPRTDTGKESSGNKLYLVDKKVLAGPEETETDLRRDAQTKRIPFDAGQLVTVPQGVVLVRAEQPDPDGKPLDRWYVLKDQPVLNGTKIKNPEQNFDNGPGGDGSPNVTFDLAGSSAAWPSTGARSPARATRTSCRRSRRSPAP